MNDEELKAIANMMDAYECDADNLHERKYYINFLGVSLTEQHLLEEKLEELDK